MCSHFRKKLCGSGVVLAQSRKRDFFQGLGGGGQCNICQKLVLSITSIQTQQKLDNNHADVLQKKLSLFIMFRSEVGPRQKPWLESGTGIRPSRCLEGRGVVELPFQQY